MLAGRHDNDRVEHVGAVARGVFFALFHFLLAGRTVKFLFEHCKVTISPFTAAESWTRDLVP